VRAPRRAARGRCWGGACTCCHPACAALRATRWGMVGGSTREGREIWTCTHGSFYSMTSTAVRSDSGGRAGPWEKGAVDGRRKKWIQRGARTCVRIRVLILQQLGLAVAHDLLDQPRVLDVHVGVELGAEEVALLDEEVAVHAPVHQVLERRPIEPGHPRGVRGERHGVPFVLPSLLWSCCVSRAARHRHPRRITSYSSSPSLAGLDTSVALEGPAHGCPCLLDDRLARCAVRAPARALRASVGRSVGRSGGRGGGPAGRG
jgi:hypothetical protein